MTQRLRILLPFFLLFFGFAKLWATHIIGGEITYKCLGNDQYQITLVVFRDCYTGIPPFDDPASVGIFDKDFNLVDELLMTEIPANDDTLPIVLANPCLVVPPNVCVNTTFYVDTVSLPFLAGGYHLIYQRCCRNQLIQNIDAPLDTGASFITDITEAALLACNNSPVFKSWPPVAICVNEPINWDHSATDADGDSIVYKLCINQNGASPGDPMPQPPLASTIYDVTYLPPFGLTNLLNSPPNANNMQIGLHTGFITGIPNFLGNFVVGVCIEEYRNGQLLSVVRRDFQYNVADCGVALSSFFAPAVLCDTKQVQFQNQSLDAANFEWYFDWPNLTPNSTAQNPIWNYPDTGLYTIALIASKEMSACRDTFLRQVHLTNSHITANFEFDFPACGDSATVRVKDLSTDSIFAVADWMWVLDNGTNVFQSDTTSPTFHVPNSGAATWTLSLVVTSANGCSETLVKTFDSPFPSLLLLNDKFNICRGEAVYLNPSGNTDWTYAWSPPTFLDNPSLDNPLANPTDNVTYVVTVTNGICSGTKTVMVAVTQPDGVSVTATPDTILIGETSQLLAVSTASIASWNWISDATLSDLTIANPTASPQETTTYFVRALDSNGCPTGGQVQVFVLNPSCQEPFVFFPTAFSPNGDGQNDVLKVEGDYIEEIYWVIYNRWGEKLFEANSVNDAWDGIFLGEKLPPDSYGFYLRVRCLGGRQSIRKGNVTLLR